MAAFSVLASRNVGSRCCLAKSNFCHGAMLGRSANSAPAVMETCRATPDEGRATSATGGEWYCTLAPTRGPEATGGEHGTTAPEATSAVAGARLAGVGAVPRVPERAGSGRGIAPSVGIFREEAAATPLPRRDGEDEGLASAMAAARGMCAWEKEPHTGRETGTPASGQSSCRDDAVSSERDAAWRQEEQHEQSPPSSCSEVALLWQPGRTPCGCPR
jgi:hypothetical protein